MKITHRGDYRHARRKAYPPITEQLDALWKALADTPLPPEAEAIRQQILATKRRFPKGE